MDTFYSLRTGTHMCVPCVPCVSRLPPVSFYRFFLVLSRA